MLQSLQSLVGWTIIPDVVTNQALKLFYSFSSKTLKKPPPPPGSPTYRKHYAYTFSFVVLSYLTYNLVQSARYMPPNFYQILGVSPNVDDAGLKSAFRHFAKLYHPDRPHVGRAGEELFISVRDAYDALKNPTVRFAYDRFGPAALKWNDCTTPGEYIHRGLLQAVGYHAVLGAALVFWSMIGHSSPVSFWRYILYATLFSTELVLILTPSTYSLSPSSPVGLPGSSTSTVGGSFVFNTNLPNLETTISSFNIFNILLPSQVAYQHVQFLHQLFIFLSVALSRVAPRLFPQQDPRLEVLLLDRINVLLAHADKEASVALHTQLQSISLDNNNINESEQKPAKSAAPRVSFSKMEPIELSPQLTKALGAEMENIIIEGEIRKADIGFLRAAWESALGRKSGTVVKDEDKVEASQL